MVHEITHLLQGIDHHSENGVMKARWNAGDFAEMWYTPLTFTAVDVALIHSGLQKRTASIEPLVAKRK